MSDNWVDTIEGLYDEKVEWKAYNISDRKICLRHEWVNDSLHWRRKIDDKSFYSDELVGWPHKNELTYGRFRFCKKCKKISCIHYYDRTEYKVKRSDYEYDSHTIGTCKRCGLRVYLSGCRVYRPSGKSFEFANKIAREMGLPNNWRDRWGSGIHCEFTSNLSVLLDISESGAEDYVRMVLAGGRVF